ncbi:MAG: stage II sporulation protein P [Clostridia bacterium]|nr:stage II sporulation protein P [Clostridia bacterium]
MKKIGLFAFLFFMLLVFHFFAKVAFQNVTVAKLILSDGIPLIKIAMNETGNFTMLSYVDLIKNRFASEDIFIELPEDSVELIPEEVKQEDIVKEMEEEDNHTKSVTMDWSRVLKNETKYAVNAEDLVNKKLSFSLTKFDVNVLIYHTHTTESYTQSKDYKYVASGDFRTLELNANMSRVGAYLAELLEAKGIKTYHDKTVYDSPSYNLSYSKAGKAITALKKKYPKASVVLDVHRDAIGTAEEIYRPIVNIDGRDVAQILLVVGTNQGGLTHNNWRENLKFALKLQKVANEEYPGFCRYVDLRKERFNQHVAPGAVIVEMGATGNTMEEALAAAELFANVLEKVMK